VDGDQDDSHKDAENDDAGDYQRDQHKLMRGLRVTQQDAWRERVSTFPWQLWLCMRIRD